MITFKNITTGESVNVYDVKNVNGVYVSSETGGREKGSKFVAKYANMLTEGRDENGKQFFTLNEGWEVVNGKGERKPRKKPTAEPKPEVIPEPTQPTDEPTQPEPQPEPATGGDDDVLNEQALIAAIKNLRGGAVNLAKVREIVREELKNMAKEDPVKALKLRKKAAATDDYFCTDFEEIVDYVADGQPVYMYGAAGCGKSHTAEQVATALGLPFYTQSQVLFAHDVKGYGDANGNYVNTPFFKAFTGGGLFFIDEMDASAPEALVVLNTAIANRRYDFPVVGCVEAHPDFRIIAAGNTALTGADVEYTARSVQDASTINRFAFFEMKYEKNVELNIMAKGDKELYQFITDLRHAINEAGVQLCVSYRQTAALATEKAVKYGRDKGLLRNVFGGRERDEIRVIYGQLKHTENVWAQAMQNLF